MKKKEDKMDTKLQDKLLDAGILPKNAVKQMEQWQNVPAGSAEKIGEFKAEKIKELQDDLEMHTLPTLRETVLDVDKIMSSGRPVNLHHDGFGLTEVQAGVDVLKRYIFEIPKLQAMYNAVSVLMRPMTIIIDNALPEPRNHRVITEISVLYSTVKEGASVPTHWFCTTESRGEGSIVRGR